MEKELTTKIIEGLSKQIDDKIKEALTIWGVNTDDHEEIKRRCELRTFQGDERRELIIDGKLVMMFTDWEMDKHNLHEPFKVVASFKCSEIITPSNSGETTKN